MDIYTHNKTSKLLSIARRLFCIYVLSVLLLASTILTLLDPDIKLRGFVNLSDDSLYPMTQLDVLDSDNNAIIDSTSRLSVQNKRLPQHVIDAFVCTEDHRFYNHNGLDKTRLIRAMLTNLTAKEYKEGASTITQQVIKNTHLTSQKTLYRKLSEMRLARALERKYTKEQILAMYLDILYFGKNIYGIASASRAFFGMDIEDIDITRAAYLVAIINNPSIYSPYTNFDKLQKRKNLVIDQLLRHNKITAEQATHCKEEYIVFDNIDNTYSQVMNLIRHAIDNNNAYNKPMLTQIDSTLLKQSKALIDNARPPNGNISVYAIDNATGNIVLCYSTSNDNIVYTRHQSGSTIKPLVCYMPALEECLITPITPVNDVEMDFNGYTPSNYNKRYHGYISLSDAVAKSSNVVAVDTLNKVGISSAIHYASKLGLDFDVADDDLTIALGASNLGFSLPQLVNAYSVFPNMGTMIDASIITKAPAVDRQDNQVIRTDSAHLTNNMLRQCALTGTARRLKDLPFEVCAKTGTVGTREYNTDAYCIAYTSKHTIGVWCGGQQMSNDITGGTLPCSILKNILQIMYASDKPTNLNKSANVVVEAIDGDALVSKHIVLKADKSLSKNKIIKAEFSKFNLPPSNNAPNDTTPNNYTKLYNSLYYDRILSSEMHKDKFYFYYFDMLKH